MKNHGWVTLMVPPPGGSGNFQRRTRERTQDSTVSAKEDPAHTVVFRSGTTLGSLIRALNDLGVTPREMISIVQDIKAAGALNAQLEII